MTNTPLNSPDRTFVLWQRMLIACIYLVCVNLLSGLIAVSLDYESLFNVNASFGEYAVPLPFTWALAHIPSMLVLFLLLLSIHAWSDKSITIFRGLCLGIFALLFLELDEKIPFVLFWKIDTFCAFIFSLILVPPSSSKNPFLVRVLKVTTGALLLFLGAMIFTLWQHRTPDIKRTDYVDSIFELQGISVQSDFRQSMVFEVLLKVEMSEDDVCANGQVLAYELLNDYPFDETYNKIISLSFFFPIDAQDSREIPIGEISLNEQDMEADKRYACYVNMDFRDQGKPIVPPLF